MGGKGSTSGAKRSAKARTFNAQGYFRALAQIVQAQQLSWRQVAKETGLTPSTLARMSQGRCPDAAGLALLSAWAHLNPADFVENQRNVRDAPESSSLQGSLDAVLDVLRADLNLTPEAERALEDIIRAAYNQLKRSPA